MVAMSSKGQKRKGYNKPSSSFKKNKSSESSSANKRSIKHERQSHRKHADIVNDAKRIWNQLRLKTNSKKQNREYMDELFPLIKGRANEIALQHDAARVIQAAIQFGTKEERHEILTELCAESASFTELCKSQYAHFCVLKAIKFCYSNPACVKLIIKALKGHMPKLAVHAVASRVLQTLFTTFSNKNLVELKQEFYGPHFSLFASDIKDASPTLESNLSRSPDKKDATLAFVRNLVNKGMEKSLFHFTYFQDICAEYCDVADSKEIRNLAGSAADQSIHFLSSRNGSRVVTQLIAYGTAKDRKRIMKSLKGSIKSGLLHRDAYLAIIRLVQLTDDTVSIHKNVFNELLAAPAEGEEMTPLAELALSDAGSKLLLMLLVAADDDAPKKIFDPYELSVLSANPTVTEDGEEVPTSKKNPEVRRKELIKHLREPLIKMCAENSEHLLMSRPGAQVLREVYSAFHPQTVVDSVIDACEAALEASNDSEEGTRQLFEDRDGHLAVKNLLLVDTVDGSESMLGEAFLARLKSRLVEIAGTNRGAFVVLALSKIASVRDDVISCLEKKKLKKLASGEKAIAGFEALLKEIN